MGQGATVTHVLMSTDDLIQLERRLGRAHPICERLREALADCAAPHLEQYRIAAMDQQCDGELEIDSGAVVSKGGDAGAYVMAWLWIDDSELATTSDSAAMPPGTDRLL